MVITSSQRQSILNQADVSLSLARHVITSHAKDRNLVISPLSINVVLGMLAAGSNGPTRDQILRFLKSGSIEEINSFSSEIATHVFADGQPLGGPRLSTANGVWIDQSLRLNPAFKEIIKNSYKAASNNVDFQNKAEQVRKELNEWAEKETKGLIKDMLEPDSDAKVDGFKVLRLPYKRGQDRELKFSMYFFLPDAKDGLPALLEKFGSESRFIKNHAPQSLVEVGEFRIPKFKISFDFEASGVLRRQGVVLPFCQGGLAEMVDSSIDGELLCVSGIIHKAFIEVNEKRTEAAAVTFTGMYGGCCGEKKKIYDFVADHPFLFVIREDVSGVLLFVGQLLR
ncbi:hypothetical protein MIMGU_mgv1a024711mg, partial [Erythranthe guttata]